MSHFNQFPDQFPDQSLFTDIEPSQQTEFCGGYSSRSRTSRAGVRSSATSTKMSSSVSGDRRGGGFSFDLNSYIFGIGAAYLFGNPGITAEEMQFAWQNSFKFW
jgi:hypothetical protein